MKHILSLLAGTCLLAFASVRAAEPIHVTIKTGATTIQGELEDGTIEGLAYQHEIVTPYDAATGASTGRRQHKPLTLVKPIDKATPLIYKALAQNSKCDEVILRFWRKDPKSEKATQYYAITLKDAFVRNVRGWKPNTRDLSADRAGDLEEVTFVYKAIEWTYTEGGTTEDTWSNSST
ncbi:MAG TPA: type VI secretion system tube protein TssD [Haloferula sp.]